MKMQRRQFIKGAIGISTTATLLFQATEALAAKKDKEKKEKKKKDELAARPDATYADAAADPEVQQVCAENGVVHLGGPMLGTVSSRGARVWVRTLKPAKVKVQVTVTGGTKTFGPVASTVALCRTEPNSATE